MFLLVRRECLGVRLSANLGGLQIGFLTEWQMYAQKLEGESWIGEKMDVGKIEKMSGKLYRGDRNMGANFFTDQQLGQMYELMQAIRKRDLEDNDPENQ
jgi:hypothetical protein